MYLIFYQKRNGEVICRIRNTIPQTSIGKETSMGWKVIDIKQRFKSSYYSFAECRRLEKRRRKQYKFVDAISNFISKYAVQLLFLLLMLLLIKKNY